MANLRLGIGRNLTKTMIPTPVSIVYVVDFPRQFNAVRDHAKKQRALDPYDWQEVFLTTVRRLADCEETSNYSGSASFMPELKTFEGLRTHMERSIVKINNITRRYTGNTWKE